LNRSLDNVRATGCGNNDYSKARAAGGRSGESIFRLKVDASNPRIATGGAAAPGAFTFARMNIVIASAIVRALPLSEALSLCLSFAMVAHSMARR